MAFSNSLLIFSSLLLHTLISNTIMATSNPKTPTTPTSGTSPRQVYIVQLDHAKKPAIFSGAPAWYAATLRTATATVVADVSVDTNTPPFLHVYSSVFHGFSALLMPSEAAALRATAGVLAVFPDRSRQPHTTRSPQFLRLISPGPSRHPGSLLDAAGGGAGAVIAMLDTGIAPHHRSFSGAGLRPPPPTWKGVCQAGPRFLATSCDGGKLVGARFFAAGFLAAAAATNASTAGDVMSPYDTDGHGTHTASTAAGAASAGASLLGLASGVASGVAPRAHVAAYKVCWSTGCFDSDILAALDAAVADGADIISLSVGAGPAPYHLDPIAIGSFGAVVSRGVIVVAAAGNDGPAEATTTNIAPWVATVGASTIDRSFPADVFFDDARRTRLRGASLYAGTSKNQWLPFVYAGNVSTTSVGFRAAAPFCMPGSLDPALTSGKVVLCERGVVSRVEKGLAVKLAGGAGMVVANQFLDGEGVIADAHLLPAVAVGYTAGNIFRTYIRTTTHPRVRLLFHGTRLDVKPAPVVAAFSGRGPSLQSSYIIKPDMIAPGVGILAAWTDHTSPTNLPSDNRRTEFNIMSGTSMACPHVSGVAALLKVGHPDWSPAAIRSAMMTTAYVTDNLGHGLTDESSGNRSTEWAHGSGQVDPEKAADPGLVYDISSSDYLAFLCSSNYTDMDVKAIARSPLNCSHVEANMSMPWDLNYPSILVTMEQSPSPSAATLEAVVRRTLTSVQDGTATYNVVVKDPAGVRVAVEPDELVFDAKGEKREFRVRVSAGRVKLAAGSSWSVFGSLRWSDGRHVVRSPVGFTWRQPY